MIHVSEDEVARLLDYRAAYVATENALVWLGDSRAVDSGRRREVIGQNVFTTMWASIPEIGVFGVKIYPIVRSDVTKGASPVILLYNSADGGILAFIEAELLGARRTGAASAVASRRLARTNCEVLTVFGAGGQAEAQVFALVEAFPELREVVVVSRSAIRRRSFAERMASRTGLDVKEADAAATAVPQADIIVTATGARTPVFDGHLVRPGTHINAVGSNFADKTELDSNIMRRARVVVDSLQVAGVECGDLLANGVSFDNVAEISSVISGDVAGRSSMEEITVFESHGLAVEDVACGAEILARIAVGTEGSG